MSAITLADFDGTLFFEKQGGYLPEDIEAVKEYQSRGNLFGLNTGRCFGTISINNERADQIHFDIKAGDTGAYIVDGQNRIIYENPMDFEKLKKVRALLGHVPAVFSADGHYFTDDPALKWDCHPILINSLDDIADKPIFSMSFEFGSIPAAEAGWQVLKDANIPLNCVRNERGVDVCAKGCCKAGALDKISEHYHLQADDLYTIGDGMNDIPAFEKSKKSFALSHSEQAVREAADYVVDSVADALKIIEELEKTDPAF